MTQRTSSKPVMDGRDASVNRAWSARLMLAMCVAVGLFVAPAALGSRDMGRSGANPYAAFPLWKDVPGGAFATLDEGELRGTRWGVYASRVGSQPASRFRPCITVAKITRLGLYGNVQGCGPLAPVGDRVNQLPVDPLYGASSRFTVGGEVRRETFFGISLDPEVVRVTIALDPGRSINRPARLVNARQVKKVHLTQFRFVAAALPRDTCIHRIVGYNRTGEVILDAETFECFEASELRSGLPGLLQG
jgi:hypothetical protein